MRRLLLALAFWASWMGLALAAPLGVDVAVLQSPCAYPGSALYFNFQTNAAQLNCQNAGLATAQFSITRATVGMAQYQSGCLQSFASGAFRITDGGLLVEEARTNSALWSNDMTNAAWVKVNMTTALNAAGADCAATANAATTLTATAANATILQTVVDVSEADTYSVWLKRGSGTGTVNISLDGVAWTAVTLTSSFQQFQKTSTLLNPNFGIQIATNGDSVVAEFNQLELSKSFATSPVPTTTVAVTRNADVVQVIGAGATIIPVSASAFFQLAGLETFSNIQRMLAMGNDFLGVQSNTAIRVSDGTNIADGTYGAGTATGGTTKAAFGMDNTSMTVVVNGGTKVTQSTSTWATQAAGQFPFIGNRSDGIRALNGYLQRAAFAIPKGIFDNRTSP